MKIHRFISNFDLSKKELEIKDKEIVNQMKNVLRLKTGEMVELCDGKNISAMAEIVKIGKDGMKVKITTPLRQDYAGQNRTKVNLYCSILKKENFELVVQKATECGVAKIIPIITARTIKTGLNLERLQKIAKEASEQCGRITIPEISEPIDFSSFAKATEGQGINILFDASGEKYSGVSKGNSPSANIFVGPEGGWTEEEITKVKSLNFKIASLGPLILRGETAAIVATYLVSNLC